MDDEPGQARHVKLLVELSGWTVDDFRSPASALRAFRRDPERYDVLVAATRLRSGSGVELARRFLDIRPDLPVIFLAPGDADTAPGPLPGRCPVLPKRGGIPLLGRTALALLRGESKRSAAT